MKDTLILLVANESKWLMFGKETLTRASYSVDISSDIAEALELARRKNYTLILIDLNCVENDENLFRNFMSTQGKQYIVILSSLDLTPPMLRKVFNWGVFDCVAKCYDGAELQRLVEKQLTDVQKYKSV